MYRYILILTGLLLPFTASAEVLDKFSSLNVEQDAATGEWSLVCESEISGIDRSQTYAVSVDIYANIRLVGIVRFIKIFLIEIPPSERGYREVVEGVSDFEIVKQGRKLVVRMDAVQPIARSGDLFSCGIGIYKVDTATSENHPLPAVQIRHEVINSGEPPPG